MKAVILVGGQGTRLRPLTYTTPKAMLPVAEVPIIERIMGHLIGYGVTEGILSMGYRPDAFREAFPNDRCLGVPISYAVEPDPLDTAGGIAFAARQAGLTETFLVVNGDVLTDLDLTLLRETHSKSGAEATIALTPVDDPSTFGVVPTDVTGKVIEFIEKPPKELAPTNLINAGTYLLEPSVLERIDSGRAVSIEREVFPAMVQEGTLFAMPSPAYWLETGVPDKYLEANLDILSGHGSGSPAPDVMERGPGVWMAEGAVTGGDVQPNSLIGRGAETEPGSVIVNSVIGEKSAISAGARISSSVLLAGVEVAPGAVIDHCIIGEGAKIGKGARLTDLCVVGGGASVADSTVMAGESVR